MSYTALYRKFRPAVFDEVKGQDAVVATLKNQILSDRIGHAYLFCGTRGTGKTSVAKLFAKAVNCENRSGADPCGVCQSCQAAAKGSASNIMEIDAASNNSVEDVRNIRDEVSYRPAEGRYKVYIIDEAHMLSNAAFNALLKTLEEPPEYVIFILATTEAAKLPVTIVSRCQRFDFRRIGIDTIAGRLQELLDKEGIEAEEAGVRYISRLADGSMRDALSLLERCVSGQPDERLTYDRVLAALGTMDSADYLEMFRAVRNRNVSDVIRQLEHFSLEGKSMASFASGFTWYLRNLLLCGGEDGIEEVLDVSKEELVSLRQAAEGVSEDELMRYIRILSELSVSLKDSESKRVDVEMTLIRLCRPAMDQDNGALLERIRELEKKVEEISSGTVIRAAQAAEPVPEKKTDPRPAFEKKAPPEALVRIRDQWAAIISGLDPSLQAMLRGSEPRYNAKEPDNTLYVKLHSSTGRNNLMLKNNLSLLTEAVEAAAGGKVRVVPVCDEETSSNPEISVIKSFEAAAGRFTETVEVED